MEPDEHWLHSNHRQVIKTLAHLLDARKAIHQSTEHSQFIEKQSNHCDAIITNIAALSQGIDETIALCGQAADFFKSQMQDPNAIPAPIRGKLEWTKPTPFQRALMREGKLSIDDIPPTEQPFKSHSNVPAPLPFTLKQRKPRRSRARDKENPPL